MKDSNRSIRLWAFVTDEEAASPVIGVVLMVAVTVILAAIVGVFVLGAGESQSATPQAVIEFEQEGNGLTIEHVGGATINTQNTFKLKVLVGGTPDGNSPWFSGSDPVKAGEAYSVADTGRLSSGTTVRVVWVAPGGDDSHVLAKHTVQ